MKNIWIFLFVVNVLGGGGSTFFLSVDWSFPFRNNPSLLSAHVVGTPLSLSEEGNTWDRPVQTNQWLDQGMGIWIWQGQTELAQDFFWNYGVGHNGNISPELLEATSWVGSLPMEWEENGARWKRFLTLAELWHSYALAPVLKLPMLINPHF